MKLIVVEGVDYSGKDTLISKLVEHKLDGKVKVLDYKCFDKTKVFNEYSLKNNSVFELYNKILHWHLVYARWIRIYGKYFDYIILNRSYISLYVYQTLTLNLSNEYIMKDIDNYIFLNKLYLPYVIINANVTLDEIKTRIKNRYNSDDNDAFDNIIIKNYDAYNSLYRLFYLNYVRKYNYLHVELKDVVLDNLTYHNLELFYNKDYDTSSVFNNLINFNLK